MCEKLAEMQKNTKSIICVPFRELPYRNALEKLRAASSLGANCWPPCGAGRHRAMARARWSTILTAAALASSPAGTSSGYTCIEIFGLSHTRHPPKLRPQPAFIGLWYVGNDGTVDQCADSLVTLDAVYAACGGGTHQLVRPLTCFPPRLCGVCARRGGTTDLSTAGVC